MALTVAGLLVFCKEVATLKSFPLFCGYLLLVLTAKQWTRLARPLHLRPVLIVYNLACSVLSLVVLLGFVSGLQHHWDEIYELRWSAMLRPYFLLYWVSKAIELMDTVFMVLRHRLRQITVLHIYHHASMVLLSDYAYHHYPVPPITLILALNAFIHILLYSYYALTAYDPSITPRWKQRLTELQILQFFIDFAFSGYGYMYHRFCIYSMIYGVVMTSLFINFYYHAYIRPRKPRAHQNGEVKKVKGQEKQE